MSAKLKTQRLNLRLLKDTVPDIDSALRNKDALKKFSTKSDLGFVGTLFVKEPEGRNPDWIAFLSPGLTNTQQRNLKAMISQSVSAVLFVESTLQKKKRIVAFTFGHGRFLLDDNCSVPDFGLKVALNTVNPDNLRSIDAATVDDNTIQTRKQASQQSSLDEFGVDTSRDLLRAVTGVPSDPNFATSVSGADALAISLPINLQDLGAKCEEVLKAYKLVKYKERYAWVDNINLVRSTKIALDLDKKLLERLREKAPIGVHMAPPAIVPNVDSGFRFSTENSDDPTHAFLDLADFMASLGPDASLDVDALRRRHKVLVKNPSDGSMEATWPAYDCLVFDTMLDESKYVLFGGNWYEVSRDFASSIATYISKIAKSTLGAPKARPGEREDLYSERAAKLSRGKWTLLDKQTVRVGSGSGRIEICDILTDSGQFVHIKPWHQSSTLSHLFAQARISTDCLLNDSKYRDSIAAKVPDSMKELKKKLSASSVDPKSFEVVLAVISKPGYAWPKSFPFFSQLNLMHTCKWLNDRQMKHSILQISRT